MNTFDYPPETRHEIRSLPVLILFPHSCCNCRCVMCDIWKITTADEISSDQLLQHAADIKRLGVEWVVFSGGEPLMHRDLFRLATILRELSVRTTVLTTGLLLQKKAKRIVDSIDDVIVSLDGPREVHDRIRRVRAAYQQLDAGVRALHQHRGRYAVNGRCTVQRGNFRHLREVVAAARSLGLESISFLAVDLASTAFHRPEGWPEERQAQVALSRDEVEEFRQEVEALIAAHQTDIDQGYIRESVDKLRRLAAHFEAHLGMRDPVAPRCNAPWVSAVVEADGTVRPCFFHPPIGNLRRQGLIETLNGPRAVEFRARLDVPADPICRRCTCSLYLKPRVGAALDSWRKA